ncbi:carbohydrate-binding protein [Cohaesibacter sp. ES.047]|uniref:carbohydrate-binding protein n=1 Tax=Cohaesibacter sp. ES.047 TaxID=1798205 RepID=UPI000BB85AFF|nr:carbohydrate-binding protein [Cohaesibacter sp. ES.047]
MTITLSVQDKDGNEKARATGFASVCLVYEQAYQEGDLLKVETDETGVFLDVTLDESLPPATLFFKENSLLFPLPSGERSESYAPAAFKGDTHRLMARTVPATTVGGLRNLSLNPYDHESNHSVFPHATANVVTRGEAAFAARSAIDGEIANDNHGFWPYTSWGINQDPEAALVLHFGRTVLVSRIVIFLRADFPHDAWWQSARLTMSDGWSTIADLTKSGEGQVIEFEPRLTQSLMFDQLIKADDPSPFPALTQLEAWGCEVDT